MNISEGLAPPKPSQYIGEPAYWPDSMISGNTDVRFPPVNYTPTLDFILETFWRSRELGKVPTEIGYGKKLPRIDRREGMLRFVVDSYRRDEMRGLLKYTNLPLAIAGETLPAEEFDRVAQTMLTDHWYDGGSIRIKKKFNDGKWRIEEELRREVAYVVADPVSDLWNSGYLSKAMKRRPGSFRLPLIFLRFLDDEYFVKNVGEVVAHDKQSRVDGLSTRKKITKAFLYLN